ncbi:T9SS type A sorting domain-containing protein [Bizionia argentinensis JUB59]|uniref:T9SS type A sorting domain-containing protein n=1 Tax=Bizionia argentinensis JUB59 TaxID=1046627 RepID=G2EHH0_9FLAO|nr:T9SS type A sorting domain-containing protein [Bizionia argentinensis]EGV42204.2 T9SS type A sorting domain-containing protein [Bizionia argentinensis JUB59]
MKKTTYLIFLFFTLFSISESFSQSLDREATANSKNIENLLIYPNPVSNGKLYVATKNNFVKQISVYNVLGKQVMSQSLSGKELNISELKAGIYIIKITENKLNATRKLIVK